MSTEPRYLFRRLVAFLVDVVLVNAVVVVLMAPLVWSFGPEKFRLETVPITISRCREIDNLGGALGEMLAHPTLESLKICHQSALIFSNGDTLFATYRADGSRTRIIREIPVRYTDDAHIETVAPTSVDSLLAPALLVVLGAAFLAFRDGRTPGKALLGLRVTPVDPPAALRREGLKFMPVLILSLLSGLSLLTTVYTGWAPRVSPRFALGLGAALALFLLWYYLVAFFAGDRRALWDRAVGTRVERS